MWLRTGLLVLVVLLYVLFRPTVLPWLVWITVLGGVVFWAYRAPPKVQAIRVLETARTFTATGLAIRLEIVVRSWLPTLLTLSENIPLTLIADRRAGLSGLFWGQSSHTLEYRITPNTRGEFVYGAMDLTWSDPLGLFRRNSKVLADSMQLLVYPGLHQLELPDLVRPLLADGPRARVFGLEDALSLRGVRDYVPGDELRRVHWKQTARFGSHNGQYQRLVVREYEQVAATGVHVHLDLSSSGRIGEIFLESATRLAASLLRVAHEQSLRVSVSSALASTESGSSFQALERVLALLATLKLEPNAPLTVPLPEAGANLILITERAPAELVTGAIHARARAARVTMIAMPEGFYLEPGESGRPVHRSPPDEVRELQRRAGILEEAGVRVVVLRGDDSVLRLGF